MVDISVEIPLTWRVHLKEQLEVLRNQKYQDFEISVASSMPSGSYEDILKDYGANITYCGPNILEKRYYAHKISRGEHSLLLDETRIPHADLLMKLQSLNYDMVVIEERDMGDSFWIRMANIDKINSLNCNDISATGGFVLPRYFRFGLLTDAFERVRSHLDEKVFMSVLMEDHQLIYYEASKLSGSIDILRGDYLFHYGDERLISILRKYHRYGRKHRILKSTSYEALLRPTNRLRRSCSGSNIGLFIFYLARGVPFLVGYYVI
jgi:hypothetical protein